MKYTTVPLGAEQVFHALGNPVRLRILKLLGEQEACFCGNLTEALGLAQSTVSHHLRVLKDAGLIKGTASGTWVCYCLEPEGRGRALSALFSILPSPPSSSQEVLFMSTENRNQEIKDAVLQHYGQRAKAQLQKLEQPAMELLPMLESSECCDTACCAPASQEALADLPQDIAEFSLGCGNPVGIASIRAGETVLDLGSGGGLDCFLAAKAAGPEGSVIGVDMNPDMLRLARKNAQRAGAHNVEFRLGELEPLPVETGAVDLIISNCVINLAPDKDRVFSEAFRVLKPGGRLCVADMVAESPLPEAMMADPQQWCGCIAGAIPVEDYLAKLTAAGFVGAAVTESASKEKELTPGARLLSAVIMATKP